jgi:hypothetical protein
VEEHVAREIAVYQLRRVVDRLERREQVGDRGIGSLAPGDTVSNLPRVRARVDDLVGAGDVRECRVQALAGRDDVAPPSRLVMPAEPFACGPTVDDLR